MSLHFARRMDTVHRSFIREILKVTASPEVISFAGGLPNPDLFPVQEIAAASMAALQDQGASALQYSTTEGHPPLREYIAKRYKEKHGMDVDPDNIIITTGSQQCLDLVAKVMLDPGDRVVIERPGYLGAIQAFSFFNPVFTPVDLEDDGPNLEMLEQALASGEDGPPKLYYAVTNFQNPSGLSYSLEKRRAVAELLRGSDVLFMEDDPYGELRFSGEHLPPLVSLLEGNGLLLGTFSKVAAPGIRLGWVVAPGEIRDKLIIAKQASDLHTSILTQRIMHRYLLDNDLDAHISRIRENYGRQCDAMLEHIDRHFPGDVRVTRPQGGMFLWASLPAGCSSMDLFDMSIARNVAFVPGKPFYVDGQGANTMRLNFSNSNEERIEQGITRLGQCIEAFLAREAGGRV